MVVVANWKDSRYLTGTSLLFLLPSFYAYTSEETPLSLVLALTSLISANFWRNAKYSIRRDLDLIVSKGAMAFMCYTGARHITTLKYATACYPGVMVLTYAYYKSHELYDINDRKWLSYHITFHAILTYEQFIIIEAVRESDNNQLNNNSITLIINLLMIVYFLGLSQYMKRQNIYSCANNNNNHL